MPIESVRCRVCNQFVSIAGAAARAHEARCARDQRGKDAIVEWLKTHESVDSLDTPFFNFFAARTGKSSMADLRRLLGNMHHGGILDRRTQPRGPRSFVYVYKLKEHTRGSA